MTGKKKLNLGPLPEELDYSKYEETVTRWDRIIGVILLAIITLALLVYIIVSLSESTVEIATTSSNSSMSMAAEASSTTTTTAQVAADAAETEQPVTDVQAEMSTPAASEAEAKGLVPALSAAPLDDAVEGHQTQVETSAQVKTVLAQVKILNPAIKQATLSDELVDNGAGSALTETVTLPASGITKIMLFTDMQGLRGQTLYHEWYRNGERQARVKIPVNYNRQNSFSSKFINRQMTGDWQVKVLDDKGQGYILAAFTVVRP